MAAPVRIEAEAFSDERYEVLAASCGLADADHARGKMARLWRQCTALGVYVLPASTVCAVLGPNGDVFVVQAGLGELHEDGIRICGTRGRIEWLKKLRKNAQKGGKAKAAKRQASGRPDGRAEAAKHLPPAFPLTLTPTPVLTPTPDPTQTQNSEKIASPPAQPTFEAFADKVDAVAGEVGRKRAELVRTRRQPQGDHQLAVDAFDTYYRRTHGGSSPTWNGKTGSLMAGLLKSHGLAEIERRIEILEHSPPKFPPPPWDMSTFAQHFDNLATPGHGHTETALDVAMRLAGVRP